MACGPMEPTTPWRWRILMRASCCRCGGSMTRAPPTPSPCDARFLAIPHEGTNRSPRRRPLHPYSRAVAARDALYPAFVAAWRRRQRARRRIGRVGPWIHRRTVSVQDQTYYAACRTCDRLHTDQTHHHPLYGYAYTRSRSDGPSEPSNTFTPVTYRPLTPAGYWNVHDDDDDDDAFALPCPPVSTPSQKSGP